MEFSIEMTAYEARGPACDVYVLADKVAVDAGDEISRIEVDVLDPVIELCGEVVAQPLGIHADLEVPQRIDARAAGLRHLFAHDGQVAMGIHIGRDLVARILEHGRPEQDVEVLDVLADEVDLFGFRVVQKGVELDALLGAVVLETGEIADRRVEPYIEVLSGSIRNWNAEVRGVARYVPVARPVLAFEPRLRFVGDLRLELSVLRPFPEEADAFGRRQFEKKVL